MRKSKKDIIAELESDRVKSQRTKGLITTKLLICGLIVFSFVMTSCSNNVYDIDASENNEPVTVLPRVLTSDSIIHRIPYSTDSLRDSVTIILHQSQNMAAMVVDSLMFDRWENCKMYNPGATTSDNRFIAEFMQPIQDAFLDTFDFVVFVNNIERRGDCGYRASFKNLQNSVDGIGKRPWNFDWYGYTNTRFEGFIHIPQRNYILRGPILHEIVHNWANYVVDSIGEPHWGVSGVGGYLGGWDPETLIELGNNNYCAAAQPGFNQFATGGVANNSVKYAPLELYLMGLLPPDEVPPVLIPDGFYYVDYDTTGECFHADALHSVSIDSIQSEYGPRVPTYETSPKEFSLLVVTVSPTEPQSEEWDFLIKSTDSLILQDTLENWGENFWTATGGRGRLIRPQLLPLLREP